MFTIKLADLTIGIDNRFSDIKTMCIPYLTADAENAFTVQTTDEALKAERDATYGAYSDGYLETLAVYRQIGNCLPHWDGFIFHAAVIETEGKAYAFAAKSGTGKTTHISHWRRAFGSEVRIVNGDKPIFRYIDGVLYACGTPWAGKEGLQRNVCVPIGGICFLHRGETNRIRRIDCRQALPKALSQIYLPGEKLAAERTLFLLDKVLRDVPLWHLDCTDSIDAAVVAGKAMVEKA